MDISISCNSSTPLCVLYNICIIEGYKINPIIYLSYTHNKLLKIYENYTIPFSYDLKLRAKQLHSLVEWTEIDIVKNFHIIRNAINNMKISDCNCGYPDSTNLTSIPPIYLYYIIQKHNIQTYYDNTPYELYSLCCCIEKSIHVPNDVLFFYNNIYNYYPLKYNIYTNTKILNLFNTNDNLIQYSSTPLIDSKLNNYYDNIAYTFHPYMRDVLLESKETCIDMENINNLSPYNLVLYGKYGDKMKVFCIDEIYSSFISCGHLKLGVEDNLITVLRLKDILEKYYIVHQLILIKDTIDLIDKSINKIYSVKDKYTTVLCDEGIMFIVKLGMYMRGWDSKSEFPLSEGHYQDNIKDVEKVKERVSIELVKFRTWCRHNNTESQELLSLPLIKYTEGSNSDFIVHEDQQTIGQRMNSIETGENSYNMDSCIRMSSNYLLSSAYLYYDTKEKYVFDIAKVKYVY